MTNEEMELRLKKCEAACQVAIAGIRQFSLAMEKLQVPYITNDEIETQRREAFKKLVAADRELGRLYAEMN